MIETKNLSFGYNSQKVLKNINFIAYPGKITSIIGSNGTGKSTLLKNISGLLKSEGEIFLDGKNMHTMRRNEIAKILSYLSQSTSCSVALNVFEVVLLGRLNKLSYKVAEEEINRVMEVLKQLNIEHLASRNIGELSGGQRQLVFIAQALVKKPKILILDEPTSSLDLYYQLEILKLLKELTITNQFTTLVTLHQLELAARFADKIIVLKEGEVFKKGTPNEIITTKMLREVYRVHANVITNEENIPYVMPYSAYQYG
ncbi:MAG: ABC transporter ATP-binding protein [Epulopiscium sp.]|nr:ABC transporter ATP-binding protein [Candidatus Epulonipiscium sp.]